MNLSDKIRKYQSLFFPLLPEPYLSAEKIFLDLSPSSPESLDHSRNPKSLYVGRYNEDRGIYTQEIFKKNKSEVASTSASESEPKLGLDLGSESNRTVHLGLDIELPPGTLIYLPFQGKVVGSKNHKNPGDYGPTLIIQHELENQIFYSLYGHLSQKTLVNTPKGKILETGQAFAEIGLLEENGGWPPHLHIQLFEHWPSVYQESEDYPGVCSLKDREFYVENSPDPSDFIRIF